MSNGFEVTSLDQLERIPIEGNLFRPIRRPLGITGFAVNAYTGERGATVIEPHDETAPGAGRHQELYLVISGEAQFEIDGEQILAPAGTLIRIDVGVDRVAIATADATTVLVVGGPPDALRPSPFEHWYTAQGPYSRGDYEEAIAIASAGLRDYPEHPTLNYQLACFKALAGRSDEALEHLRTAVAGRPEAAQWAADDADLDSIRDDPRFPAG